MASCHDPRQPSADLAPNMHFFLYREDSRRDQESFPVKISIDGQTIVNLRVFNGNSEGGEIHLVCPKGRHSIEVEIPGSAKKQMQVQVTNNLCINIHYWASDRWGSDKSIEAKAIIEIKVSEFPLGTF